MIATAEQFQRIKSECYGFEDRQDNADATALAKFLRKHGKPCPSFHAESELGMSHNRFLVAAKRIGAVRTTWGFWTVP